MDLIGLLARGRCQTPTPDPVIVEMAFFLGDRRRADLSNFLKLAEDALNTIAWDDDSQIIEAHVRKHVDKLFPRTEIQVWRVPT
jgi:Holliday junction resolvase RusA-like endonuclease